jgi:2-methylcitrate dehydratase PrpD
VTELGQSITDLLADFSSGVTYADLPEGARADARAGLMDTLGVALGGMTEPGSAILLAAESDGAGPGSATVLGRDEGAST